MQGTCKNYLKKNQYYTTKYGEKKQKQYTVKI